MTQEEYLDQTYQFAKTYHAHDHSGHDFEHIRRVYANMQMLLEAEPKADAFVCKMGALLHDIDDHKMGTDGKVAERFLYNLGLSEPVILSILETIDAISFSKSGANPHFKTLEMKLLSDADKLDAMGAVGLCRAVSFSVSRHQPLFNEDEMPCAENKEKHMINHFFAKLLLLKGAMQTNVGQKEAKKRHKFMIEFLQQFFAEQNLATWQNFLDDYLEQLSGEKEDVDA